MSNIKDSYVFVESKSQDQTCIGIKGGKFAGVSGFGKINMPIAKSINASMSSPTSINLNIKYPMSLIK